MCGELFERDSMTGPRGIQSAPDMLEEVGAIGSYANGNYVCKCRKCERLFLGDKRATVCLPCVIGDLQIRIIELHSALRAINQLNDHPGRFDIELQKILDGVIDTSDTVFPETTKDDTI
jgi:hypothetical protein